MSMHEPLDPEQNRSAETEASPGYKRSDVLGSTVVVFVTALGVFAAVAAVLSYGIGRAVQAAMLKESVPDTKWTMPVDVRPLDNASSGPQLHRKLAELTQPLPTPRVQSDDGNQQDLADLHVREDLLLENYSWADRTQGKVRIPIELAMEIVAKDGLPLAPAVEHSQPLTGEEKPTVAVPLTRGFARTGYEQEQARKAENKNP